jgi:hypothetical protein
MPENSAPASGGDHHGAGVHGPGVAALAADAARADDLAVGVGQQFQGGRLVKDPDPGTGHLPAHPAHVLGPLNAPADLLAVLAHREGIAPLRHAVHLLIGLVEHAVHPPAVDQPAAHGLAAPDRFLPRVRVGLHVPDPGARARGRAGRAAVALVD